MPQRNEPDDEARELDDAVEAEYQAGLRRVETANRMQSGVAWGVTSRDSIRRRLRRERKEAQEARIRELQERALRQRLARPDEPPTKATPLQVPNPYPREQLVTAVTHLVKKTATHREIERETGIKRGSRLGRLVRLVKDGELGVDEHGQLRLPPGTRTNASGDVIFS